MRFRDLLALLALFVLAVLGKGLGLWDEGRGGPGPRRPLPEQRAPSVKDLAPPALPDVADPSRGRPLILGPLPREVVVRVPKKTPSVGTAFAVDRHGHWLTARHVVDGCTQVWIMTGPRRGIPVTRIVPHPNADLSVLSTTRAAPPLEVRRALEAGREAFNFGFPHGQPGAVYSNFLGTTRLRTHGRYSILAPVYVWAERLRVPSFEGTLGGLSGGPLLDRSGAVIGVAQAEAPRRGRIFSAVPPSLLAALKIAGVQASAAVGKRPDQPDLNGVDFPHHGRLLMGRLSVAKVLCRV